MGLLGGVGVVNAFVSGASDLVFIGSFKNIMTQSILAKPEVTKLQDLKGKKIGVTRIGSNTHYFSVQALRRAGMSPEKDVTFIQTGGDMETLGALFSGTIDAASMLPPTDGRAIARGFRLSTELVAGVLVGAGIGWLLDWWLGSSPLGMIVFLLLGFVAGVLNVMRAAGVVRPNTFDPPKR